MSNSRERAPTFFELACQYKNAADLLSERFGTTNWSGGTGIVRRFRPLSTARSASIYFDSFKPYFTPGATEDAKAASGQTILKRLNFIAEWLNQDYLLGAGYGVADAYLFVMLMWAYKNGLSLPVLLPAYYERMKARPAVQRSLKEEGLLWSNIAPSGEKASAKREAKGPI
jgi:glutathione S-transferase